MTKFNPELILDPSKRNMVLDSKEIKKNHTSKNQTLELFTDRKGEYTTVVDLIQNLKIKTPV